MPSQPEPNALPITTAVQYVSATALASQFSVVSALIAPLLLTRLQPGRELLNMIEDSQIRDVWADPFGFIQYAMFLAALFAWGTANWYGSRVLLQRSIKLWQEGSDPAAVPFINLWVTWFPRVLGVAGMFWVVLYILVSRKQWFAGSLGMIVVASFLALVITRRSLFQMVSAPEVDPQPELRTGDRVGLWLSLAFALVLLIGLTESNIGLARLFGAPVVLLLALSSLVIIGSVVLTFLPMAYGWPSLAWVPIVAALVIAAGAFNRNHLVTPRLLKITDADLCERVPVEEHFQAWLAEHDRKRSQRPIILVAAEGGASRSAWWSSHVLSVLDYASDGEFSQDVYAISGVSGGSLGAATYVSLLAERIARREGHRAVPLSFPNEQHCRDMRANRADYPLPMQSECFVGRDFVSTTLGYLLFPDLLQRVVPVAVSSWDRSLGLEKTWEHDWANVFGSHPSLERRQGGRWTPMSEPISTLYRGVGATPRIDLPLLLLNTTRAKAGRSVLQAPVALKSAELDDFFHERLNTRGLPLSGLIHNSARFPVVSPGGDIDRLDGDHWDSMVDGGYFENSGAATLAELVRVIAPEPGPLRDRIQVLVLMNDPGRVPDPNEPQMTRISNYDGEDLIRQEELLTPVIGLYNTRSARADSSKRFLADLLKRAGSSPLIEVKLEEGMSGNAPRPAMTWYLNPISRRSMWQAAGAGENQGKLCHILSLSVAEGEDQKRACARLKALSVVSGGEHP